MNITRYLMPAGTLADGAYDLNLTPERAGWDWSGLRILTLDPGGSVDIPASDMEYLVLPLNGGCTVMTSARWYDLTGRDSIFTDITDYMYIPRDTDISIVSHGGARIALPAAQATAYLPIRYCPREEVDINLCGAGVASYQVNNYALGNMVATSHLLVSEVLTPSGNWSAYPPYKHDNRSDSERNLEQISYFEISPGPNAERTGFALQRINPLPGYEAAAGVDVRSGDVIIVPHGYYGPCAAPPGYDVYTLQIMAGPAEDATWMVTDDPDHAWARSVWDEAALDPRLPLAGH